MESSIQDKVVKFAKRLRVMAKKLSFGEGWPDFLFLYRGRILFIEFKAPGEKPEPLQAYVHELIRAQGFQVEVVDSVFQGKELIKEFVYGATSDPHVA